MYTGFFKCIYDCAPNTYKMRGFTFRYKILNIYYIMFRVHLNRLKCSLK